MFSDIELRNCIQIQGARLILALYVQPNAKRTEFEKIFDNRLKLKVQAPPEDGRANEEIIRYISASFKVKKNQVTITSGDQSRRKKVEITFDQPVTLDEVVAFFAQFRT